MKKELVEKWYKEVKEGEKIGYKGEKGEYEREVKENVRKNMRKRKNL